MNGFLFGATVLSLLTFGAHVFAGGPAVARPLLRSKDLDPIARYTNFYCWHLVSIMLAAMVAGFALGAFRPASHELAVLMTVLAGSFCVWSVVLIVWKHRRPLDLPQWALFLPITVLGVLGLA